MVKNKEKRSPKLDVDKLADPEIEREYHDQIETELQNNEAKSWGSITTLCLKAAEKIIGHKKRAKRTSNPEINRLSQKRQELYNKLGGYQNHTKNEEKIANVKKQRRTILKEIRKIKKTEAEEETKRDHEHLETMKNDSNKYYQVNRQLQNKTPKQPIFVKDEDGSVPATTEAKAEIIKKHFKKALAPEDMKENIKSYTPTELKTPITTQEITKAVKSMKNGKSCGEDGIYVELIKYAPIILHDNIKEILNNLHSGETPTELITGLLAALQKPGKKKGPPRKHQTGHPSIDTPEYTHHHHAQENMAKISKPNINRSSCIPGGKKYHRTSFQH